MDDATHVAVADPFADLFEVVPYGFLWEVGQGFFFLLLLDQGLEVASVCVVHYDIKEWRH